MKMNYLLKQFLETFCNDWGINAMSYKIRYVNALISEFGEYDVKDITALMLDDFFIQLSKKNAKATILKYKTILRQTLNLAVRYGYIKSNPIEYTLYPRKENSSEVKILTQEQILDVINTVTSRELKYKVLTMLYVATAARRNEILGLKWKKIDFNKGILVNDETIVFDRASKSVIRKPLKNKSICTYKLCHALLTSLMVLRNENFIKFGKADDEDYIFLNNEGELLRPSSITTFYKRLSENKPYKITPHIFRHSVASYLVKNGTSIPEVSAFLGHKDTSVTMKVYVHMKQFPADVDIADKLSSYFLADDSLTKNKNKQEACTLLLSKLKNDDNTSEGIRQNEEKLNELKKIIEDIYKLIK